MPHMQKGIQVDVYRTLAVVTSRSSVVYCFSGGMPLLLCLKYGSENDLAFIAAISLG